MRLLLILGLICIGCYLWGTKEDRLCRALSNRLGCHITVKTLAFEQVNALSLRGVQVYDSSGASLLSSEKITISWEWRDLLRSPLTIKQMTLSEPRVHTEERNWERLLKKELPQSKLMMIERVTITPGQKIGHGGRAVAFEKMEMERVGGMHGQSSGQVARAIFLKLLDESSLSEQKIFPDKLRVAPSSPPKELDDIRRHLHHLF